MIFLYDATFEGLLTVCSSVFRENGLFAPVSARVEEIRCSDEPEEFLFGTTVRSDPDRARAFAGEIVRVCSDEILRLVQRAFFSEATGREILILRFLEVAFREGPSVSECLKEDAVRGVQSLAYKVSSEAGRMRGLIRFSRLDDGVLYAVIEPRYFILPLVAGHFQRRMPDEDWIIRDARREKALVCSAGTCVLRGTVDAGLRFDAEEDRIRKMWKEYFRTLAVKDRENPGLQRQFVPLLYRKHMTEFQ